MSEQDNHSQMDIDSTSKLMAQIQNNAGNIFLVVALGVAGFFGWQYWTNHHTTAVDMLAADKYIEIQTVDNQIKGAQRQALLTATDTEAETQTTADDNAKKIERLHKNIVSLAHDHSNTIYAWQALMLKARNEVDNNQFSEAVLTLESATNVTLEDKGLQAITHMRYAQALLANNEAEKALNVLNSKQFPVSFNPSKQELLGDIKVRLGDMEAAKTAYTEAWNILSARKESRSMLALKMESLGIRYTPIDTNS